MPRFGRPPTLSSTTPWAALLPLMVAFVPPTSALGQEFSVQNFVLERFVALEFGITALDFAPSGIMYATEKQGRVLAYLPDGNGGFESPQVFLDITGETDFETEGGLLGVAVDPDHTVNRFIYLFVTTASDQRVVRYTADPSGTRGSSPAVILSGLPRATPIHKGGDIQFRPGDRQNLYITLGDDGDPAASPNPLRYEGKMLRIDKGTGQGLPNNPFRQASDPLSSVRARIWAVGLRNAFRFAFHPVPGQPSSDVLYTSENGDNTDKVAWVRAGSDGGWSPAGDPPFLMPADPNHRVMFTGPGSLIGIAIATSGPFADQGQPTLYLSKWFPSPFFIRRWRLEGPNLDSLAPVAADGGQPFLNNHFGITLKFGPDGSLYYCHSTVDQSPDGEIGRIRFVGGDPPVASFTTDPTPARGPAPFTVTFTDTSVDPDGAIVSRSWDFGDGETAFEPNPTHTYGAPGTYIARLTVVDDDGLSARTEVEVAVSGSLTLTLRGEVLDGSATDGSRLAGSSELLLADSSGRAIAFPGGLGPEQNGFLVTDGAIAATLDLELTSPILSLTAGSQSPMLAAHTVAFEVPLGAGPQTQTVTLSPAPAAIRGRAIDTRGAPARVDIGIARAGSPYPIAAGRDLLAGSGAPETGVPHRVTTDVLGGYYFPVRDSGIFTLDVARDTNVETYVAQTVVVSAPSGPGATDLEITVGLLDGGQDCDSLEGIPETPNVDYPTQIQPIWDASCVNCHQEGEGSGGLNLITGLSYRSMVGVPSLLVPGKVMVEPGNPERSFLLEKLRCGDPQTGDRMPPGTRLSLESQALVRDWIAQGAQLTTDPGARPPAGGGPPGDPSLAGQAGGGGCRCLSWWAPSTATGSSDAVSAGSAGSRQPGIAVHGLLLLAGVALLYARARSRRPVRPIVRAAPRGGSP